MDRIYLHSVLIVSLAVATCGCRKPPYSSPAALRDTNAYSMAIAPAAPPPVELALLEQTTASLDGETLVVTRPMRSGSTEPGDGFGHRLDRLGQGERLSGENAAFELVAISVNGASLSPMPTNQRANVALQFYSQGGKGLSREELMDLGFKEWQLTEYVDGSYSYSGDSYPKIKAWFGSRQHPPGYMTPVGLFDGATKQSLSGGYSYSQITADSFGSVELRPHAWHAVPLELVMDVELDGRCVVETNSEPGTIIAVPGGLVRLVGVWSGDARSWSSQNSSSSGTETMRISLRQRESQASAVAVFVTEPQGLAVHFDLCDEQGNSFEGNGGGTAGGIRVVGLRANAPEVKRVRLAVSTNHHRVLLTLPPVPNLPAGNQPVQNLFDVPVPMVKFQTEYQLRDYIGQLTQMKFAYFSAGNTMPTNVFPMVLTNVTAADLLALYQRHLTNNLMVAVDEKKLEIRVEPTPLERAKRWVRQKLRF